MAESNQMLVREEPERLADILKPLVPLAATALENTNKELELKNKQFERQAEHAAKTLDFTRYKFNRAFWLLAVITASLLFISAGIIFGLRDITTGLGVLSHVMAIAAGAIGGAGWQRSKERTLQ